MSGEMKPILTDTTAAVVAGGKSSRFGSNKALASFRGRPLLSYAVGIARAVANDVLVVAASDRDYREFGVPVVGDLIPDCGPIGGIYTALQTAETPAVAVLPCDLPLLSPKVYEYLRESFTGREPVAAVSHRGLEPLVSIWPRSSAPLLEQAIRQGRLKLRVLMQQLNAKFLDGLPELPDYRKFWFCNVNSPADLDRLVRESR